MFEDRISLKRLDQKDGVGTNLVLFTVGLTLDTPIDFTFSSPRLKKNCSQNQQDFQKYSAIVSFTSDTRHNFLFIQLSHRDIYLSLKITSIY